MRPNTTPKAQRRRATPDELKQRKRDIVALLEQGFPVADIARKLNIGQSRIYEMIRKDPKLKLRRSPFGMGKHIGRIGRTSDALARESEEFLTWIKTNIPEGGTVSEFLVSCALDAFQEETAPAKPTI
jgi:transposase